MSGLILGDGLVAEVIDPVLSVVDAGPPTDVVEALGPPEVAIDVLVPELGSIEMDIVVTDVLVLPIAGAQGAQGVPGQDGVGTVITEIPTGVLDGSNVTFTTALNYAAGSTRIYLNGLRNFSGTNYAEDGGNAITLSFPPVLGDLLIVEYSEGV